MQASDPPEPPLDDEYRTRLVYELHDLAHPHSKLIDTPVSPEKLLYPAGCSHTLHLVVEEKVNSFGVFGS